MRPYTFRLDFVFLIGFRTYTKYNRNVELGMLLCRLIPKSHQILTFFMFSGITRVGQPSAHSGGWEQKKKQLPPHLHNHASSTVTTRPLRYTCPEYPSVLLHHVTNECIKAKQTRNCSFAAMNSHITFLF